MTEDARLIDVARERGRRRVLGRLGAQSRVVRGRHRRGRARKHDEPYPPRALVQLSQSSRASNGRRASGWIFLVSAAADVLSPAWTPSRAAEVVAFVVLAVAIVFSTRF